MAPKWPRERIDVVIADPLRQTLGITIVALIAVHALWLATRRSPQRVRSWAWASLAAHLTLAAAIWVYSPLSGDARVYDLQARGLASAWQGLPVDSYPPMGAGKEGFAVALGVLYRVAGPVPWAGIILNTLAAALLVVVVSNTTAKMAGPHAARAAPVLATILPPFMFWPSLLLREAWIWLLIALIAESMVAASTEGLTAKRGRRLVISFLLLTTLRAPIAALLALVCLATLVWSRPRRSGEFLRRMGLIGVLAISVVALFRVLPGFQRLLDTNAEDIASNRNELSISASTGFGDEVTPTSIGLVSQLPRTIPIVVFGPFPARLRESARLAWLDVAAWWFGLIYAVKGYRTLRGYNHKSSRVLVAMAAVILLIIAVVMGNIGIVIRERAMALVLLVPLASVGLSVARPRRTPLKLHSGESEAAVSGLRVLSE